MNKYQVVTASNPSELVDTVHEFILEGWKCQGGVAVAHELLELRSGRDGHLVSNFESHVVFYQAMVKGEANA